jgi:hypothetical protein
MTEIGLFDAMYTARTLRRLKPDAVPKELIIRVLDAAIRAPSSPTLNLTKKRSDHDRAAALFSSFGCLLVKRGI